MLIVSRSFKLIFIIFFYYLVSSGIPIVPFTPKKLKEQTENQNQNDLNKEKEIINNDCENNKTNNEKMLPTVFVPTSLIINPILKSQKNIYNNKYQKKKQKPFMERTGDWICKKCKNLNFSFRQECNRCKLPKKEVIETEEKKEENNKIDNNGNNYYNYNNNIQQYKKNKYRFKKYS